MAASTATRTAGRLGLLLLFTGLALLALAGIASAATWAPAEERFVSEINRERTAAGLPTLAVDVQLTRVARGWSGQMLTEDRMYHNPGLGSAVAGDWTRLGENVGFTIQGGVAPETLVDRLHVAFMNSPGHRENVMGDWNAVGVGVLISPANKMWVTVNFSKTPLGQAPGQLDEAASVAGRLFPEPDRAGYVVLGRSEVFADALGGAGLAGNEAPILFTPGPNPVDPDPVLHPKTRAEIDRVLPEHGTIYLLGGPKAVSPRVEAELAGDGYDVRRLAGFSRVETSVRVAEEVLARRGVTGEVLLARADTWADAISGGAYSAFSGSPVVLTSGDQLDPAVATFLARPGIDRRIALGGRAALSDSVVAQAKAQRIAGEDRTATAVEIAKRLWGRTEAAPGDQFVSIPGFAGDGWAYSLALAPFSAMNAGPQLLVGDQVSPAVQQYLSGLNYGDGVGGEVESSSIVPPPVVEELRALVQG